MNGYRSAAVSHKSLVHVAEHLSAALFNIVAVLVLFILFHCQIVGTQNHILGRNSHGTSVGGFQKVVSRKHKEPCLCLSLCGKGQMDSHLVSVEVGVERGTNQRVKLNGASLNQYRLERLDTQSVKRRCAVQEHGVILDNVFQSVPNVIFRSVNLFAGGLDIGSLACVNKTFHYKRLEQLQSHFLGETALEHFQFRAYNDNRTSRVVNTFAQQVLTETSLLTFKHIGKRLKGAVVGTGNRSAVSAVVDKSVNGFLKHSLFVSYDDVGSFKLQHLFKTVISVDNAPVKIVKVGGGVSAAVQHNHRSDIGGNNRNNVQNHPFGLVSRKTE